MSSRTSEPPAAGGPNSGRGARIRAGSGGPRVAARAEHRRRRRDLDRRGRLARLVRVDLAAARPRRRHLDRPAADPARRAPRRARAGRDRDPRRDGGRVHRLGLARGLHLPPAQHPVVRAAGPRPALPDGARAGPIAAVRAAAPSGDLRDDRGRRGLGDLGPRVRAAQRRVRGDRLPLPAALPARRAGAARLRRARSSSAAISS